MLLPKLPLISGLAAALHALCNRPRVVEFCNADEIQLTTRLYAAKGGAYISSHSNSVTIDMAGTHMGSSSQAIGTGSDEAVAIPADVTGLRWLEVKSMEAEGGNYVEFSIATGGSFAASVFCRLPAAGVMLICVPSGTTIYAKANTGAVNIDFRAAQV